MAHPVLRVGLILQSAYVFLGLQVSRLSPLPPAIVTGAPGLGLGRTIGSWGRWFGILDENKSLP